MSTWKELLELEWQQVFGRHSEQHCRTWGLADPIPREPGIAALKRSLPLPRSAQAQVIRHLETARLRHWMKAGRPCPWHGARTNTRWHAHHNH